MFFCAWEFIQAGFPEYWNDIVLFSRNQLAENQMNSASYVTVDNTLPNGNGITYRDIDKRMIGGYTGGSLPNSISLSKSAPRLNGQAVAPREEGGLLIVDGLRAGDTVSLTHPVRDKWAEEPAAGRTYRVLWRGCDVIDILPHGEHLRLYQRDLTVPQVLPKPEDVPYTGAANYGPTQQKR